MSAKTVVLRGTVREKLEALADHYGVDREAMWAMTVLEFTEAIDRRSGRSADEGARR